MKAIILIIISVADILITPLLALWVLNTLCGSSIPYTIKSVVVINVFSFYCSFIHGLARDIINSKS